ncbi:MAG: hypothetical protein NW223_08325, partial [Hyphomicrobiaceae bacterium]|nr:hypothetical protein [Hyphomicrobiaceae bacterium]
KSALSFEVGDGSAEIQRQLSELLVVCTLVQYDLVSPGFRGNVRILLSQKQNPILSWAESEFVGPRAPS